MAQPFESFKLDVRPVLSPPKILTFPRESLSTRTHAHTYLLQVVFIVCTLNCIVTSQRETELAAVRQTIVFCYKSERYSEDTLESCWQ
jgi:hypothetical protein